MNWPNHAAYAFVVTIDVDGDLPLLAEHPGNVERMKSRSAGLYGPEVGVPRLLRVMSDLGIVAHWFTPGEIARRYPRMIREVHESGQRIGVHGDRHLDFGRLDLSEQVEEMVAGRAAIQEIIGQEPQGFRTPAGEWAPGFPEAMDRAGFTWSSSLASDELPFPLTGSGLIEVPFRYELEDQQYLAYNLDPPFPPGLSRITPLESVADNWWCEVRGAERFGTLVHLRLNAEVMGTPGRARMLHRFLAELAGRGTAWFTTCDEVAAHSRSAGADPDHPYAMFMKLAAENR